MKTENKNSSMAFLDEELSWRYERKGLINSNLAGVFISHARRHAMQFNVAYEDRVVNNIFLIHMHLTTL